MRPRPSLFVAVAAAALGQRSSATRTGGGLEHLLVQHGSGACARRARTRCALTSWCSGRRWPRLSVDCCVLLLTMSEEETRASARGAFCSLAVYGTLSRPASRNADVAAFGSRCTPRAGASIFISAVLVLLLRRGRIRGASRAQAEDLAAVAKKTRQLEGPGSRTAKKLRRRRHRRLAGSRVTGAGGFARCRTTPQWRSFAAATTAATGRIRDGEQRGGDKGARAAQTDGGGRRQGGGRRFSRRHDGGDGRRRQGSGGRRFVIFSTSRDHPPAGRRPAGDWKHRGGGGDVGDCVPGNGGRLSHVILVARLAATRWWTGPPYR